jgi:hypothetical protein
MSEGFQEAMEIVEELSVDQLIELFRSPDTLLALLEGLTPEETTDILIAKNIKVYGGINEYVTSFLDQVLSGIAALPNGAAKERAKAGQRIMVERLLTKEGLTDTNKQRLQASLQEELLAAPAAGGKRWKMPRKMTRRYCKKTSCRKMGFTQKASCRPWKNCY